MSASASLSFVCGRCGQLRQVGVSHAGDCRPRVRPAPPLRRAERLIAEILAWLWSAEGLLQQWAVERDRI